MCEISFQLFLLCYLWLIVIICWFLVEKVNLLWIFRFWLWSWQYFKWLLSDYFWDWFAIHNNYLLSLLINLYIKIFVFPFLIIILISTHFSGRFLLLLFSDLFNIFLLDFYSLFSHIHNFINFFWRLRIHSIHSLAFCAFDQSTSSMWINHICFANSTCKHTIKRKTFIYFITHATYVHLTVSRYWLCECAFVTVYSPIIIKN